MKQIYHFILCHLNSNKDYNPKAQKLLWKDGKKAAFTLAFDDSRKSHHEMAWPEMQKRGIVGTFNVNTPPDLNWTPWKYLAEFDNEIASHTVYHLDLTSLSSEQVEWELKESLKYIEENIGIKPVSFSNPFRRTNTDVERLISKYYLSARNQYGINDSSLTDNEYYSLKGISVFPSVTREYLNEKIQEVISRQGYLIVYFHSISTLNEMPNETYMTLSFYQNFLDDVVVNSDNLWIATQRDIIKYMRIKQNSSLEISFSENKITCLLTSNLSPKIFDIPISIKLHLPENWKDKKVAKYFGEIRPFQVFADVDSTINIDAYINEEIFLKAF